MARRVLVFAYSYVLLCVAPGASLAHDLNPNFSVLAQPYLRWTDDPEDESPKRPTLRAGEVEMYVDAYLNPYAKGVVITSLTEDGLELEEGYFDLFRGLPAQLQLKGGQYRVDFGKLNRMHPHQLPFAERPRVFAAYLPGEESFNEVGVSLSSRVPMPGSFSLTAAADWLQGDSFRLPRSSTEAANDPLVTDPESGDRAGETRSAFVGHLSGFGMLGERSGFEVTLSGTGGTNNVAARTRTLAYDLGGKVKLWTSARSYLLLQGEFLGLDQEQADWDSVGATYTSRTVRPVGGYFYADYNFSQRYNAGISFESYQQPVAGLPSDYAYGAFVGLSLLEETTSFRLDWNHYAPGAPDGMAEPAATNTITLRAIFSMGPHKAHAF